MSQFQSKKLIISTTFIILFSLFFFISIPLKSNPFSHSTTHFTTFTSYIFSLTNFINHPLHSKPKSPVFAILQAPSPNPLIRVENRSGFVSTTPRGPCDIFDGTWVYDDSYPIYAPGSCPFVEVPFNCYKSGRPDLGYLKYRWQPHNCDLPRFDSKRMLEMLKGKRMVFVGDSLNRNMVESLVCSLGVFDVSQRTFLAKDRKSFEIKNDDISITMISAPFLVQQLEEELSTDRQQSRKKLRIDTIHETVSNYSDADIIIFNTGKWWNNNKVQNGEFFFQEGDVLHKKMEVGDAYTKALQTWADWVDQNVNTNKTQVFFMGYTADHFKGNRQSGRGCDREAAPIKDEEFLKPYPWLMETLETVIGKMSTPVTYLNITKLTDFRKDAHPSLYRWPGSKLLPGIGQDCSHWCLPGVPDSWNQLLYASMLLSSTDN